MRTLFISSNSSPRGGGEDFIIYLARVFRKFNKENLYAIYSDKEYMNKFANNIKQYTKKIIRIEYKQLSKRKLRFLSSIFDVKQIFKIYKAIKIIKPKLIIVNQQYDEDSIDIIISSIIYKVTNFSYPIKIVCIIHMPRVENKIKNQPLGFFRYICLLFIYGLIRPIFLLTSKDCLNEFKKYYFLNQNKTFLLKSPLPDIKKNISKKYSLEILNNSEISDYSKNKLNKWLANNRQIILLGCQMNNQKNPLFAFSCWLKLRQLYKSKACFLIIGEGPLRNKISDKIANLSSNLMEDTLQLNWVPDLSRYILISDLLLMPSSFEGMNLTLLECVSYNKQIILGKFEGINEIRNFTNCFTQIDTFDEKIWAEKINEKLCEKINKRKKNFLNKKFLSHYSDYECFQSFQESIN